MGENLSLEPPWKIRTGLGGRNIEFRKASTLLCHLRASLVTSRIPPILLGSSLAQSHSLRDGAGLNQEKAWGRLTIAAKK
jgi:hypothetical protein